MVCGMSPQGTYGFAHLCPRLAGITAQWYSLLVIASVGKDKVRCV